MKHAIYVDWYDTNATAGGVTEARPVGPALKYPITFTGGVRITEPIYVGGAAHQWYMNIPPGLTVGAVKAAISLDGARWRQYVIPNPGLSILANNPLKNVIPPLTGGIMLSGFFPWVRLYTTNYDGVVSSTYLSIARTPE